MTADPGSVSAYRRQIADLQAELAETNQGVVALSLELQGYQERLEELVALRTEQLRQATERANEANRAKSAFLASMSHELRTPMNAILGFTHLLRHQDCSPAQRADYLDIIARSGDHLLALINDVLDMAKIESGRLEPDWGAVDITALAREVVDLMSDRAQEHGLDLDLRLAATLPATLRGDGVRLRQILLNLLGNAIKATPSGYVRLEVGSRSDPAGGHWLVADVVDTGVGIATEDVDRIFEPFRQAVSSTGGTGLGLPISRTFAELMGGTLTVVSRPGEGSRFRLQLPLQEMEPQRPATSTAERLPVGLADERRVRVLVVEDQTDSALLLRMHLAGLGIEAAIAEDGARGVALAEEMRPDLIFMDRRMPVMDGIEATRLVRATEWGRDLPIVGVTASVLAEDREQLTRAGMNAVLPKPYRATELVSCLASVLGLTFRYDHPEPSSGTPHGPLCAEHLADLDAASRRALTEAALSLDPVAMTAAVALVAPDHPAVADRIALAAAELRYEEILDALDGSS